MPTETGQIGALSSPSRYGLDPGTHYLYTGALAPPLADVTRAMVRTRNLQRRGPLRKGGYLRSRGGDPQERCCPGAHAQGQRLLRRRCVHSLESHRTGFGVARRRQRRH